MLIEPLNQTEHVTGVVVLRCMRENVKKRAIHRYHGEKLDAEKKQQRLKDATTLSHRNRCGIAGCTIEQFAVYSESDTGGGGR